MRRGAMLVLGVILLISFVGMVSAFGADDYAFTSNFNCADFGLECGTTGGPLFKNCGACSSNEYCYFGKCIEISAFGPCERPTSLDTNCETAFSLSDFYAYPGQPMSQRLEAYKGLCENYGCTFNSETKKCTGIIPPCSYFQDKSCTQNDNEEKQSVFNEQNRICTTTWKNFPKVNCDLRNGQWNEAEQSCTYVSDLTCLARDDKFGSYYCRLRNTDDYVPNLLIYKSSSLPIIRDDGANMILLDNDELRYIEEGGSIPISIKGVNFGLPEGTPISFTIYNPNTISVTSDIINLEISTTGIINEQGEVNAEWTLTNEELSSFNDYGYSMFATAIYVRDIYVGGVNGGSFTLKAKTGECSGTARVCSDYSDVECLEIARFKLGSCTWNYETSSCDGGQGMSCDTFEIKESCRAIGCSWRADSFWERFTDWIKGIFGR